MKETTAALADGLRVTRSSQSGAVRFSGSLAASAESNAPYTTDLPELAGNAMAWLGGLGLLLVLFVAGASAIRSSSV